MLLLLSLPALAASAQVVILPPVRDVTPPGMTPGPEVDGTAGARRAAGQAAARGALVALLPARDDRCRHLQGGRQDHPRRRRRSAAGRCRPVRWPTAATGPAGARRSIRCAASCTAAPSSATSPTAATSPTSPRPAASATIDIGLWLLDRGLGAAERSGHRRISRRGERRASAPGAASGAARRRPPIVRRRPGAEFRLGDEFAGQRLGDQRPRLGNAVDRHEGAEARPALLAEQDLVERREPRHRHAGPAVGPLRSASW